MPSITGNTGGLEYFDGFDDYATAQLNRYWNQVPGGAAI